MSDDHILYVSLPVPVPVIKKFSRWQVFLALFSPRAHFTTCEALRHELYNETKCVSEKMLDKTKKDFLASIGRNP